MSFDDKFSIDEVLSAQFDDVFWATVRERADRIRDLLIRDVLPAEPLVDLGTETISFDASFWEGVLERANRIEQLPVLSVWPQQAPDKSDDEGLAAASGSARSLAGGDEMPVGPHRLVRATVRHATAAGQSGHLWSPNGDGESTPGELSRVLASSPRVTLLILGNGASVVPGAAWRTDSADTTFGRRRFDSLIGTDVARERAHVNYDAASAYYMASEPRWALSELLQTFVLADDQAPTDPMRYWISCDLNRRVPGGMADAASIPWLDAFPSVAPRHCAECIDTETKRHLREVRDKLHRDCRYDDGVPALSEGRELARLLWTDCLAVRSAADVERVVWHRAQRRAETASESAGQKWLGLEADAVWVRWMPGGLRPVGIWRKLWNAIQRPGHRNGESDTVRLLFDRPSAAAADWPLERATALRFRSWAAQQRWDTSLSRAVFVSFARPLAETIELLVDEIEREGVVGDLYDVARLILDHDRCSNEHRDLMPNVRVTYYCDPVVDLLPGPWNMDAADVLERENVLSLGSGEPIPLCPTDG